MKYYKIINGQQVFFKGQVLHTATGSIINPKHEDMLSAGWNVYVEPPLSENDILYQAKMDKFNQIDTYGESVKEFIVNDIPMWLGHELRQQVRTSAEAYKAVGETSMTKVFNGVEFTFDIDEWLYMLNLLEVYASEVLNTSERHKLAVEAIDNVNDVRDYDYTANYPNKLIFGNTEPEE